MLTASAYDTHVEQLLERMRRLHLAFDAAGIQYRIVGGMAVFIHVADRDPEQARLTADVDAGVSRADLAHIIAAAERRGFDFRHTAGVDMLVEAKNPRARSSVHLVYVNEKVRPEYVEAVPSSPPERTKEGILIAPVVDLVHMKLTSFRLKDKVHIQDLDSVGLIIPEIEATLSPVLAERLAEVRASE